MPKANKKLHRMDDVPKYRNWIKARDKALEQFHTRAQLEAADELRRVFGHVLLLASTYFHHAKANATWGQKPIDSFDHELKSVFRDSATRLFQILTKLKVNSYVLAKVSQAEIIAQLLKRRIEAKVNQADIQKVVLRKALAGGPALHRLELYMDRLRRKILNAAQLSSLHAADVEEFLYDVGRAFPKRRVVKQPRRVLKPKLMEADTGDDSDQADFAIDLVDDKAWKDMLDDYMSDPTMQYRQPEYVVNLPISDPTIQRDGSEVWYAWEFEQEMTNEFVQSVRDGEIEAANDNGITDFVWIAVVDDKTDSCCLWRDGLLVSEIEQEMSDHADEDDECGIEGDGLTPPLHFNCRCTVAPATEDIPEKPDDGGSEFDDWLMNG